MDTEKHCLNQELKESFQYLKPFIDKRSSYSSAGVPQVLHTSPSRARAAAGADPSLGEKFTDTNATIFPSVEQGT